MKKVWPVMGQPFLAASRISIRLSRRSRPLHADELFTCLIAVNHGIRIKRLIF